MALGMGVVRGLGITLRHFVQTYVAGYKEQPAIAGDVPYQPDVQGLKGGMPSRTAGLITSQYPDQKLPTPERFRYIPFLVFNEDPDDERAPFDGIRCTACGICAKVCPPQCIWIVQGKGPDGRPRPVASEFYIDASICMSCGFCAEYCPFDAIKMDHEYEVSTYERRGSWVFSLQDLLHPAAYHAAIHPTDWAREVKTKRAKAAAKAAAEAKRRAAAAESPSTEDEDEEALRRRKAEARKEFLEAKARREAKKAASESEDEGETG